MTVSETIISLIFCVLFFVGVYKCIKLIINSIKEIIEKNNNVKKQIIEQNYVEEKNQVPQKNYIPKKLPSSEESRYIITELLTPNEKSFYNEIKEYMYERGLHIITKIRLADLIEPKIKQYQNKSEWQKDFNKICSKHIDFAIVNNNMQILFLIELDDSTHNYNDRKERDDFINTALVNAGYRLLRVYNNNQGITNVINYLEKNF